jgi:hypothetical protein
MPSRRASFQGPLATVRAPISTKRNLDVIHGLDYFATATDIIGNQLGGASLRHVHANILAGLYHGQLGRVVESFAYIAHASKIILTILRP